MTTFQVAIHVGNTVGAIFYKDGKAEVRLDHIKKEAVEKFLATPLTMDVAVDDIHTFETKTLQPLESVDTLKVCLTRLWEATGVYVAWSRPIEV